MGVWKGVATNAGNALFAAWALGGHTLTITKATVGSGYVAEINMRTATALQNEEDNAAIVEKESLANGTKFRIRVSPAASTAYDAHEIGLWAKLDNGTETLISLHQDPDTGVSVPTVADNPEFVFDLFAVLAISNDGTLTVTISTSVFVSNGQMMAHQAKQDLLSDNIIGTVATPTLDANGDITALTHTDINDSTTVRTDTFSRTSTKVTETRTLASGDVLTIETTLATGVTTYTFTAA